jgi:hypothetical protein
MEFKKIKTIIKVRVFINIGIFLVSNIGLILPKGLYGHHIALYQFSTPYI